MDNAWDSAFNNSTAVADSDDWRADWETTGARFRRDHADAFQATSAYGGHDREAYDVFEPDDSAHGTLIFIHGGYWRALSRRDNHAFAAGPLARGWRVVFLEYPLCPEVTLESLCASVTQGIDTIAGQYAGDLVLAGHSAGGHLATFAVSQASALSDTTRQRVRRALSISGLHDLRPMTFTTDLNATLGLDLMRASALSPALSSPHFGGDVICLVGADELPELRRQSALLANIWAGLNCATQSYALAGEHHFSILEGLKSAGSALTRWATLD